MQQKTWIAVITIALLLAGGALFINMGSAQDSLPRFEDRDEFRSYLEKAPETTGVLVQANTEFQGEALDSGGDGGIERLSAQAQNAPLPNENTLRHSSTNVQEQGIDEPDILKNDGDNIYYSLRGGQIKHILPTPPSDPSVANNISDSGELLLNENSLVVLSHDVYGYDVSNSREKKWTFDLNSSTKIVDARLYDDTVYLVLKQTINRDDPCPIEPYEGAEVRCSEIRHPPTPVYVDSTYTIVRLNPVTGEVEDRTSFVGSSRNTVVYMSQNSVYVAHTESKDRADIILDFAINNASDLFNDSTLDRFEQLRDYELSTRAKLIEIQSILEERRRSSSRDEGMRMENEFRNRFRKYVRDNVRSFEQTNIVEITVPSLNVQESGSVPGTPLNQWSLDEHEGNLRIATTVGGSTGVAGNLESANDVYILNEDLEIEGSVQGLGLNERIYSVRYMGDKAYVVTFRRIDPFHVLDLSNPSNPKLEGELKLPGFSSYLHPIGNERVLGIGMENRQVKAVMFDVSDPSNPVVEDDYILNDYSTEVLQTHHAFLHDPRHNAFFLPGNRGGYIFTYENGLSLEATVDTDSPATRALYIGDYMYVFSNTEAVVLNENTWDRTNELRFKTQRQEPPRPIPLREQGGTTDNVRENVLAGVNVEFDAQQDMVNIVFVSNQNAEYINVSFSGGVEAPQARMNSVGSRVTLGNRSIQTTGEACVYRDGCSQGEFNVTDGAEDGDRITVTVTGVNEGSETVLIDESGSI